MKESALYPVGVPPTKAMMKAHEVLAWIAFRRAVPFEQFHVLFYGHPDTFRGAPERVQLWALEARAGLLEGGPFCGVSYPEPAAADVIPSYHHILTKTGPSALRFLRALYRKHYGELLSFPDIARLYREKLTEDWAVRAQLNAAGGELKDRAAGGLVHAFGLPVTSNGRPDEGAMVEAIPGTLFMHLEIKFSEWNQLGFDAAVQYDQVAQRHLPRFAAIQFRTVEILKLWPVDEALATFSDDRNPKSVWFESTGVWVALDNVILRTSAELGVEPTRAAKAIRDAVELDEITARVPTWSNRSPWDQVQRWVGAAATGSHVTISGFKHVNWDHGTLNGFVVELRWPDVVKAVTQAIDDDSTFVSPKRIKAGGGGGAPPKHTWDAFWIEVALWAGRNDVEEGHRRELQKHMEDWTAANFDPAPDAATIRKKIAALFEARRRET